MAAAAAATAAAWRERDSDGCQRDGCNRGVVKMVPRCTTRADLHTCGTPGTRDYKHIPAINLLHRRRAHVYAPAAPWHPTIAHVVVRLLVLLLRLLPSGCSFQVSTFKFSSINRVIERHLYKNLNGIRLLAPFPNTPRVCASFSPPSATLISFADFSTILLNRFSPRGPAAFSCFLP